MGSCFAARLAGRVPAKKAINMTVSIIIATDSGGNVVKSKPGRSFWRRVNAEDTLSPMVISPVVGESSKASRRIRVLLPEPLLPIIAMDSPCLISRLMSLNAVNNESFYRKFW